MYVPGRGLEVSKKKKKKIRIFWKPARVCINGGIQEGRSDPWPSGWAVCCGDPTGDSALGREQNAPLSESGGAPRGSQGCYFGGVVVRWVVGGGKEARNRSKHFFPTPHKTDSCRRLQGEVDFGRCLVFFFFFNVGLEDSHSPVCVPCQTSPP